MITTISLLCHSISSSSLFSKLCCISFVVMHFILGNIVSALTGMHQIQCVRATVGTDENIFRSGNIFWFSVFVAINNSVHVRCREFLFGQCNSFDIVYVYPVIHQTLPFHRLVETCPHAFVHTYHLSACTCLLSLSLSHDRFVCLPHNYHRCAVCVCVLFPFIPTSVSICPVRWQCLLFSLFLFYYVHFIHKNYNNKSEDREGREGERNMFIPIKMKHSDYLYGTATTTITSAMNNNNNHKKIRYTRENETKRKQ